MRRLRLVWEMASGLVSRDPLRVELAQILWDKESLRVSGSSHVDMDAARDLAVEHGCTPRWVEDGHLMVVGGPVGCLMSFGCALQDALGYEETA